jgi:hypothetical protein
MKRTAIVVTLMVALGVVAGVVQVRADMCDDIATELNATDERIRDAREVVQSVTNTSAQGPLQQAEQLQLQAWELFRTINCNDPGATNLLAQVKQLTLQAREKAFEAAKAGRTAEQYQNSLRQRLEQASDLLVRAREVIGGVAIAGHLSSLESAREALDHAWEMYQGGQYRAALRLCSQVEETARRIIDAASLDLRSAAQFEHQADMVRDGIERAQQLLINCRSGEAPGYLSQAQEAFDQALQLHAQGGSQMALKALQNARKLASQATRECRGGQPMQDRYERLRDDADRLSAKAEPGDEVSGRFLATSYEQLKLAADYIAQKNTTSAAAALRAAELTLQQLKRHLRDSEL